MGAVWNTSLSHYKKASSGDLPTAVKVPSMCWLFSSRYSSFVICLYVLLACDYLEETFEHLFGTLHCK